jgi:hypothetical protein
MADNAISRLAPRKRNALEDLTQGVSRGFWADGIGGPVDMLTTLANLGIAGGGYAGHKLGLLSQPPELIQNPVGGSEWIAAKMRSNGLLNDNPGSTADAYGRVAGGLLAPLTAARAPQIANALNQAPAALQRGAYAVGERAAGMAENQLVKQGGILPATVWHGSPHKFDKFDASKIGTGEGAQAYGHGLYLAESPEVAKTYTKVGDTRKLASITVDGAPLEMSSQANIFARNALADNSGDISKAVAWLDETAAMPAMKRHAADLAQAKDVVARSAFERPSNLYKVDLPDEQIAKMLDWDKPLHRQAPQTRKVIRDLVDSNAGPGAYAGWIRSRPDFRELQDNMLENLPQSAIAEQMRQRGISGIRYLDGGSRTAGQGSSNFVVFPGNEGLLSILERNGQPLK